MRAGNPGTPHCTRGLGCRTRLVVEPPISSFAQPSVSLLECCIRSAGYGLRCLVQTTRAWCAP